MTKQNSKRAEVEQEPLPMKKLAIADVLKKGVKRTLTKGSIIMFDTGKNVEITDIKHCNSLGSRVVEYMCPKDNQKKSLGVYMNELVNPATVSIKGVVGFEVPLRNRVTA